MDEATLSERLIDLVEPFRYALHGEIEDDFTAYKRVVPVGVIAWNLSLLPAEQRERIRANVIEGFDPEDRRTMTRFLDEAIARKNELYPEDRRFIREARVTAENGALHLQVASASG